MVFFKGKNKTFDDPSPRSAVKGTENYFHRLHTTNHNYTFQNKLKPKPKQKAKKNKKQKNKPKTKTLPQLNSEILGLPGPGRREEHRVAIPGDPPAGTYFFLDREKNALKNKKKHTHTFPVQIYVCRNPNWPQRRKLEIKMTPLEKSGGLDLRHATFRSF